MISTRRSNSRHPKELTPDVRSQSLQEDIGWDLKKDVGYEEYGQRRIELYTSEVKFLL